MKKEFKVLKISNMWSTEKLRRKVEDTLNQKSKEGWDIISIDFGIKVTSIPTAFITIAK